jgi:hypothetical protein
MARIDRDEPFRRSIHAAVVDAASALVSGHMGVVEAARRLSKLRFDADAEGDDDFLFFLAIDSETDHFPVGKVRENWSASALAREDALREGYERDAREDAIKHAHNLIRKYRKDAV